MGLGPRARQEPADSPRGSAALPAPSRSGRIRPCQKEGQQRKRSVKVALLYNARTTTPAGAPDDTFEEYDSDATISSIAAALHSIDADVEPVQADARLPWRLAEGAFDFAFNMAEGKGRRCREA